LNEPRAGAGAGCGRGDRKEIASAYPLGEKDKTQKEEKRKET